MQKNIYIATTNQNKLKEFKNYFNNKYNFLTFSNHDDVNENGSTFIENAKIKANYYAKQINYKECVIAEDSGLCIETLDGFPGIYSARFNVDNCFDYKTKNSYILKLMENKKNKRAYFTCAIAFIDTNKNIYTFKAISEGLILDSNTNKVQGFGYDPIFYDVEHKKFYSELSIIEKNRISHRGKAFKELSKFLNNFYNTN